MKLIRKKGSITKRVSENKSIEPRQSPWKVLLVDDEEDIHNITELNLKGFQYAGRELSLIKAYSANEARSILEKEDDIAVALIDVVMESDEAGLELVKYIRNDLDYQLIRLFIRTGQPGMAPERFVIDHYDIDGYSEKTELTAMRLYTTVRSALKAYRDIKTIDMNREGLAYVLEATDELYTTEIESIGKFFQGVLTQIIGIFHLGESGLLSTVGGMITTIEGGNVSIQARTGEFAANEQNRDRIQKINKICCSWLLHHTELTGLRKDSMVIPLEIESSPIGFVYLENTLGLTADERDIIRVMVNQSVSALDNLRLHMELSNSYDRAIDTLALVAEFKDSNTGEHINRLAHYTEVLADEMGLAADEIEELSKASRLHDVGKVGIPDSILKKDGKLSPEEFEVIKTHAVIGDSILAQNEWLTLAREIAYTHHERWDGSGYPNGLAGEDIPLTTRIVSVVDVFDALINARPYKPAWEVSKALSYLEDEKGKSFDADVVDAFLKVYSQGLIKPVSI
ncbi:MAG: DUF3369 domain-containing protein [Gammaproteobacteria bacterium]|nr:DUF3369 domain-containing protein [Gammaproteobacteria bacterium]